jgi:hypothetical protein
MSDRDKVAARIVKYRMTMLVEDLRVPSNCAMSKK